MSGAGWPAQTPVVQVRVARPTDQLDRVVEFYERGLGLTRLGEFRGHAGYDGVMLGLPGADYHLEFTSHVDGSPGPAPTLDNLLVLYFADAAAQTAVVERFAAMGHPAVPPENPFWTEHDGVTVVDPDGWRIVLMPAPSF